MSTEKKFVDEERFEQFSRQVLRTFEGVTEVFSGNAKNWEEAIKVFESQDRLNKSIIKAFYVVLIYAFVLTFRGEIAAVLLFLGKVFYSWWFALETSWQQTLVAAIVSSMLTVCLTVVVQKMLVSKKSHK